MTVQHRDKDVHFILAPKDSSRGATTYPHPRHQLGSDITHVRRDLDPGVSSV